MKAKYSILKIYETSLKIQKIFGRKKRGQTYEQSMVEK